MRYVHSRYKAYDREEAYRIYVTDSLRLIGHINIRYADAISTKKKPMTEEEANNEAERIKAEMIAESKRLVGGK